MKRRIIGYEIAPKTPTVSPSELPHFIATLRNSGTWYTIGSGYIRTDTSVWIVKPNYG
jgi:hypothetical protein